MINKELLKTIILDNQSRLYLDVWDRNLDIPLDSNKIITLSGVRRSGKTYHLFGVINKLKTKGVDSSRILYLNFDDERFSLTSGDLDLILQAYQELFPDLNISNCYFLFDEVQEIEGWEKFVSRIYASISQKIFITGSNSKLLSREISTTLRGRTLTYEVYPLSFNEYLKIVFPKYNINKTKDRNKLANLFSRFMKQGGFPETIKMNKYLISRVHQEYFNTMLFRDLVDRFKISQVSTLKYFCKRLIANSAYEFSVNKIYNDLKSQGYQISKDSLYLYQDYVEAIYMCRLVSKFSHSVIKSEGSRKKSYIVDHGMGMSLDYKFSHDKGRILENLIALEFIKSSKTINYSQNGSECDFLVTENEKVIMAVQVCYYLESADTYNREVNGLVKTCQKLGLKKGFIVNMEQEKEINVEGIAISIVPAWKYLLEFD